MNQYEKPKVGIKLGHFKSHRNSSAIAKRLLSVADYIEYQAPTFSFEYLVSSLKVPSIQLRPHGVHLSLAHGQIPTSIIKRLANEVAQTKTPFLAEHIGFLNPDIAGASMGYIIPPPLNSETAKKVACAVLDIQRECGVPVALENPVFYTLPRGSDYDWPEFIQHLSSKLPTGAGWLIDFAHLEVSCRNLGSSLSRVLESYRDTGRPVYEVHVAGAKRDSRGVYHDYHNSTVSDEEDFQACLKSLDRYGIQPLSFTLEREYDGTGSVMRALNDLKSMKKAISNRTTLNDAVQFASSANISQVARSLRATSEKAGRVLIAARVMCEQLATAPPNFTHQIASAYGYSNFINLAADLMASSSKVHLARSIPRFDPFIWDGVDLLGPLFSFLQAKTKTTKQRHVRRELLVEIALLQVTLWSKLNKSSRPSIFIELSEDSSLISAGLYKIEIDERDQVVSTLVTHQQRKEARGAFFFSDKGGGSWQKPKRSAKALRTKSAESSEKRQLGKCFVRSMKILTEDNSNRVGRAG